MIKANELRIGNWVDHYFPDEADENTTDRMFEQIEAEDLINEEYLKSCFPIPLTPEILEKAGFVEGVLLLGEKRPCSKGWHLLSYGNYVTLAYDYDDCAYETHNSEYDVKIEYLHHLQNLIHALTGEELNIQL